MKAIVRGASGSPELRDVDVPVPTENEVLVRVHASSLNDYDLFILGRPPLPFRVVGSLLRAVSASAPSRVRIGGSDVAGSVVAVGSRIERFSPGDAVFGDVSSFGFKGFGAFAEYVCAPESALLPMPACMTFEQAAALPQAGALAMQGLLASGPLQPGRKILINGAGGGVGTISVQVAKLQGAEVTGVDRASKFQMMRSIGFDYVIDYEQQDFTRCRERYDLILDTKANRSLFAYMRVLKPGGTYVTVGGETTTLFQFLIFGGLIRLLAGKKIVVIKLKQNAHLVDLKEFFEAGHLVPVIDGPYKLSEWHEAFHHFSAANHEGKVILTMV
jgi:NADPH:quinone reductase-like Zn-dependent oxidoreductase